MKKSILSAAIAASTAALMSGGAMAYDSVEYLGTAANELHYTRALVTPGDSSGWGPNGGAAIPACPTGSNCDLVSGMSPGESSAVYQIQNKTITAPVAPGVNNYVPTQDCYEVKAGLTPLGDYDASGNLVSGDIGSVSRVLGWVHFPTLNPATGQPADQPAVIPGQPTTSIPPVFSVCTDGEGKIESGYITVVTQITGFPTQTSIVSFDRRRNVSFNSGTSGLQQQNVPTIAEANAIWDLIDAGTVPAPSGYGGNSDWSLSAAGVTYYETCDITQECGQFGKSVPVPAFAAAALGLGLLGITYLTGRRRAIK